MDLLTDVLILLTVIQVADILRSWGARVYDQAKRDADIRTVLKRSDLPSTARAGLERILHERATHRARWDARIWYGIGGALFISGIASGVTVVGIALGVGIDLPYWLGIPPLVVEFGGYLMLRLSEREIKKQAKSESTGLKPKSVQLTRSEHDFMEEPRP